MKTAAIVILILSPVFAFGERSFDANMFNGYMWEEFGKDESLANLRISLLAGFVSGFDRGYLAGYVKGVGISRRTMLGELGKMSAKPKQRKAFQAMISEADNRSWIALKQGIADDLRIRLGPKEKVEEYCKDVDQFLKKYPLCKKHSIFTILDNLVRVWEQTDTHKNIGEKCSED